MAHIQKYKASAVGHMLAHYTRRPSSLERDNIDKSRTPLNYTVGIVDRDDGRRVLTRVDEKPTWETVEDRIEAVQEATGRRVRKDAVVMADIVLTAPKNVPERDLERFFRYSYGFIASKVGRENMLGGFVHMDETTPHMHASFTPIKDGKFSFKQLCPRSFYQSFHKELGKYLESKLGYMPEVELSEEKIVDKVLSSVPQEKLDVARTALENERESLQREVADLKREEVELNERLELLRQRESREYEVIGKLDELTTIGYEFDLAHDDGTRSGIVARFVELIQKMKEFLQSVGDRAPKADRSLPNVGLSNERQRAVRATARPRGR